MRQMLLSLAVFTAMVVVTTPHQSFACANHPPRGDAAGPSTPTGGSGAVAFAQSSAPAGSGRSGRGGFFSPRGGGASALPSQLDDRVFDGVGRQPNPNWTSAIQ